MRLEGILTCHVVYLGAVLPQIPLSCWTPPSCSVLTAMRALLWGSILFRQHAHDCFLLSVDSLYQQVLRLQNADIRRDGKGGGAWLPSSKGGPFSQASEVEHLV